MPSIYSIINLILNSLTQNLWLGNQKPEDSI